MELEYIDVNLEYIKTPNFQYIAKVINADTKSDKTKILRGKFPHLEDQFFEYRGETYFIYQTAYQPYHYFGDK